jgi:hypothetical protein
MLHIARAYVSLMVPKLEIVGWVHVAEHHFGRVPFPRQDKLMYSPHACVTPAGVFQESSTHFPTAPPSLRSGQARWATFFRPSGTRRTTEFVYCKVIVRCGSVRTGGFEAPEPKTPASKDAGYNS